MNKPKKISLANIPTPLQSIKFDNCSFLIKRDDLTGLELSGNKVRKLEYLIYDALKEKATTIITCGGDQSNHARATAFAAIPNGLKVKLLLWGKEQKLPDGNLFLDTFLGANIKYLTSKEFNKIDTFFEKEKDKQEKKGEKTYIIPEGGSSPVGIWGYIDMIEELKDQVDLKKIKGILTAAGSGGTSAGLLIGAALNKLKLKVIAVNVLYPKEVIKNRILSLAYEWIRKYKIPCKIDIKALEVIDGYSKEGYKDISSSKLALIKSFAASSGIVLDPAYTGKAFCAYYDNYLKGKKKSDVIFIHTGGFFGIFDKRKEYLSAEPFEFE
jgi:D-cysteine desulfhydrase